jgi:flagellum-specific peptidoglycan hydrolase FlgJ
MYSKTDIIESGQIIQLHSGHVDVNLLILRDFLVKYWLNVAIVLLLLYGIGSKRINLSLHFGDTNAVAANIPTKGKAQNVAHKEKISKSHESTASLLNALEKHDHNGDGVVELLPQRTIKPVASAQKGNEANLFQNVSAVSGTKVTPSVFKDKQEKCRDYVARFINVARTERQKFGIPVSVILAQGLLESDAGESRLTRNANNHFGIKTFNKKVPHVVMKDDVPNDKFKKYNSAWESYRDHSLLLMKNHYKHLQFLSKTDYVGWAKGLEKAGYATDKQYAEKLTAIIENLQLYRFDEA